MAATPLFAKHVGYLPCAGHYICIHLTFTMGGGWLSHSAVPNVLSPGTGFVEDNFSLDGGGVGIVSRLFKCIIFKLTSCCVARFLPGPDDTGLPPGGWGSL